VVTLKQWLEARLDNGEISLPVVAIVDNGEELAGSVRAEYIYNTLDDLLGSSLPLTEEQFDDVKSRFTPVLQRSWDKLKADLTQ
jgi:hypothetical protein